MATKLTAVATLRILTTAELSAPLSVELRTLVDRAFAEAEPEDAFGHADDAFGHADDAFGEDDWQHALGGWHVVLDAPDGGVGPTFVRDGDQLERGEDEDEDDGIMVLRFGASAEVDLTASITCQARVGDDW